MVKNAAAVSVGENGMALSARGCRPSVGLGRRSERVIKQRLVSPVAAIRGQPGRQRSRRNARPEMESIFIFADERALFLSRARAEGERIALSVQSGRLNGVVNNQRGG